MELILLRHGKAEDFNPSGDSARSLVEKGREQAWNAGRLLKATGLLPEIVLTSPLNRAVQTAFEFCRAAGISEPVQERWLASGMRPETGLKELAAFTQFERVLIVGHEPDFSQLIEWTTGGSVEIKKAALTGLQIYPPSRHATLRYMIPPVFSGQF